jgi:hypothetical protein
MLALEIAAKVNRELDVLTVIKTPHDINLD